MKNYIIIMIVLLDKQVQNQLPMSTAVHSRAANYGDDYQAPQLPNHHPQFSNICLIASPRSGGTNFGVTSLHTLPLKGVPLSMPFIWEYLSKLSVKGFLLTRQKKRRRFTGPVSGLSVINSSREYLSARDCPWTLLRPSGEDGNHFLQSAGPGLGRRAMPQGLSGSLPAMSPCPTCF